MDLERTKEKCIKVFIALLIKIYKQFINLQLVFDHKVIPFAKKFFRTLIAADFLKN